MRKKLMNYTLSFVLIAMVSLLSIPSFTHAEVKTFEKEYTYRASEEDPSVPI